MHDQYYKTSPSPKIDIYRVLKMWEVTDPAIQHAVKKLLCSGKRGAKQDLQEAVDSINRSIEMLEEESLTNAGEQPSHDPICEQLDCDGGVKGTYCQHGHKQTL